MSTQPSERPTGGPAGPARLPFTGDLRADSHGIWSHAALREVSYPAGAHDRYALLEDASYWFSHRNQVIVDAIRRHPPPGLILDVGGGNGYVTRRLLDEGFDAALLEPGPAGALNARLKRAVPDVLCATLEDAAFRPGSLGAAGCFDVLEHIPDDQGLVDRIRGLLMPGGLLYATVPAGGWLWSSADAEAGHHRRYAAKDVERMVGTGFDLLRCDPFFGPLVVPVFLARALPFRLGARKAPLSAGTEHGAGGGAAASMISALLRREARRLAGGGRAWIGTSLLVVARRREGDHG